MGKAEGPEEEHAEHTDVPTRLERPAATPDLPAGDLPPLVPRRSSRPVPSADVFERGASIGRYVIIDLLGRGGMGVVYSAYDTQLDRKLAIKLLRSEFFRGNDAKEIELRLLREAQAMARLTHPNVVAVHDVGTHDGRVFLAMDFVEGVTLKKWLKTPHPFRERLSKVLDAGRGLAAAHRAGLIHRDFKPDNILVADDGRVVVLDFGLARAEAGEVDDAPLHAIEPDESSHGSRDPGSTLNTQLTLTGSVLGTVGYMAPEQALGEEVNAATDQFSFAVTLFQALYGEKPFPGSDLQAYIQEVFGPLRESAGGKDVPKYLRKVVARALSAAPKDRYPSLDAMLVDIDRDPRAVVRTWAGRGTGALSLVLVIAFLATTVRHRATVCLGVQDDMASSWSSTTIESIRAAFHKSHVEGADSNADRVIKRLSDYAAAWTDSAGKVCRQKQIEKRMPDEDYLLRTQCLERQRVTLKETGKILGTADDAIVSKGLDIAYGLPQLAWCDDVTVLKASKGYPDDPIKREEVRAVDALLAKVDALSNAGEFEQATAVSVEAVARARTIGFVAEIADALLTQGGMIQTLGHFREAAPLLREATFLAMESKMDATAVNSTSLLATIEGAKLQRVEEGRIWLSTSKAMLKRLGSNELMELGLLSTEASLASEVDWHPELALKSDARLVRGYQAFYGTHPMTENALYNAGVSYSYLGDPTNALSYFQRAVDMARAIGGDDYPDVALCLYMLGQSKSELGNFVEGERDMARAIERFIHRGANYWVSISNQALVWSLLARGEFPSAADAATLSLTYLEKAERPSVLIPIVSVPAATAYMRADRVKEGLALCEAALQELERSKSLEPEKVYGWDALRCKGEALVRLGRPDDAIPLLERSLTLTRRMFPGDYALAQFALARAIEASHRDHPRALAEARAALDATSKWPFLKVQMSEISSWIAEHETRGGHAL